MVTKSKLKMALVADKGTDFKKEHQKKMVKASRKEKKDKTEKKAPVTATEEWEDMEEDVEDKDEEGSESGDEVGAPTQIDFAGIDDSDTDSSSGVDDTNGADLSDDEDDEDVPLSDLEDLDDEEKEDMIPHQRLTINNTAALTTSLKRIALPLSTFPFSEHQSLTTSETVTIEDVSDDLTRELAFYAQSLSAVKEARGLLKAEGAPFSRPTDYFAEMVKADEHMAKIKAKLVDAAAGKKAAAEARKQRDLKKFGKQVQVAKLQERQKEKTKTMEDIKVLKRKRQGADAPAEATEVDLFDVALEDAASSKPDRREKGGANKRHKKDEKFGFGGKKRYSKSGDAQSSGDLSGFSAKRMKGKSGGAGAKQRPGKARRAGGKR